MTDKPLELKTAVVLHEKEQGPRIVANVILGACDAFFLALHNDIGAGVEADAQAWLASSDGSEFIRLAYAYAGRAMLKRASAA